MIFLWSVVDLSTFFEMRVFRLDSLRLNYYVFEFILDETLEKLSHVLSCYYMLFKYVELSETCSSSCGIRVSYLHGIPSCCLHSILHLIHLGAGRPWWYCHWTYSSALSCTLGPVDIGLNLWRKRYIARFQFLILLGYLPKFLSNKRYFKKTFHLLFAS